MRHVPIAELQARASEIATAVELGEEIVITRDGRDFGRLVAMESTETRLAKQRVAIDNMIAFREELRAKGVRISQAEIREWIDEGRR